MIFRILTLSAAACALGQIVLAQPAQQRIVSPGVAADRTVTLRLRMPNAKEVLAAGEFTAKPLPMQKGADGVWTVTLGPLEPDIYSYTFRVDGTAINDPANPDIKAGVSATQSLFTVPAKGSVPYIARDLPRGSVHRHWYTSKSLGDRRSYVVYTPPLYDGGTARYPVLFLLHGSGDLPTSWVDTGKANVIMDNLIVDGKARAMIVVMPSGHAAPNRSRTPEGRQENVEAFAKDLLGDVMPEVDRHYRTLKGPEHRAIAGLSMGGGQALWTGLTRTDVFGSVAAFSAAVPAERYLPDVQSAAKKLKVLWIAIGKDDFLLDENTALEKRLAGAPHSYKVTEGAHTWRVWRKYLAEVAPQLFK